MIEDVDYFNECMNANFFIYKDKVLLSDLTNFPSEKEFQNFTSPQIEKKYNHFHLSFITPDVKKQKKYALMLWEKWRKYFELNFPQEQIEIQLSDNGNEIIIWVYRL